MTDEQKLELLELLFDVEDAYVAFTANGRDYYPQLARARKQVSDFVESLACSR